MKKYILQVIFFFAVCFSMQSCKENLNALGTLSPYIAIIDVRELYKGSDLTLTREVMRGDAHLIRGYVVSSPADGNNQPNTLVLQGNQKEVRRGITIEFTSGVENYKFGDSLVINVENTVLAKVNGSLRIKGVNPSKVTVASENNIIEPLEITIDKVFAAPDSYEGVLLKVFSNVLNRDLVAGETFAGDKSFKDSSRSFTLHTEATANFSNELLPASATFTLIPLFYTDGITEPVLRFWLRNFNDVVDASGPIYPNFPEDFENVVTALASYNYTTGVTGTLKTGSWNFLGCVQGNSLNDRRNGTWAMRSQRDRNTNSVLEMRFDVNDGVSKITYLYGSTADDPGCFYWVEYSQDLGVTWRVLLPEKFIDNKTARTETIMVDLAGKFRLRFIKKGISNDKPDNGRLNIDDVAIYKKL